MDIFRQLTLFLDDTDHGLNLEPVSLEAYFGAAQRWMEYRVDYENYLAECQAWQRIPNGAAPPLPPSRPTVPRADIEQALSPVFIRRRRRDIHDLYGDTPRSTASRCVSRIRNWTTWRTGWIRSMPRRGPTKT